MAAIFVAMCAFNERGGGPQVDVHIDNRSPTPANLILFDARTGTVLDRLHNLNIGETDRSIPFRNLEDRRIGAAVDVHGEVVPVPIGGTTPQTITLREPSDVICIDIAPRRSQDFLYRYSCVD